jgi:hypothetical protein
MTINFIPLPLWKNSGAFRGRSRGPGTGLSAPIPRSCFRKPSGLSAPIPGAAAAQNKAMKLPLAISWAHNCLRQLCSSNQAVAILGKIAWFATKRVAKCTYLSPPAAAPRANCSRKSRPAKLLRNFATSPLRGPGGVQDLLKPGYRIRSKFDSQKK